MKSEELSVNLSNQIVSRNGSWIKDIKPFLKFWTFPGAPWAPSLWSLVRTISSFPKAGHPTSLSNQARRALVREVTKNPMATQKEVQMSSIEIGKPAGRRTISINRAFMVKVCLDGWHLKDSESMRKKVLWSDETKIVGSGETMA